MERGMGHDRDRDRDGDRDGGGERLWGSRPGLILNRKAAEFRWLFNDLR
jgi:hypothetical protein